MRKLKKFDTGGDFMELIAKTRKKLNNVNRTVDDVYNTNIGLYSSSPFYKATPEDLAESASDVVGGKMFDVWSKAAGVGLTREEYAQMVNDGLIEKPFTVPPTIPSYTKTNNNSQAPLNKGFNINIPSINVPNINIPKLKLPNLIGIKGSNTPDNSSPAVYNKDNFLNFIQSARDKATTTVYGGQYDITKNKPKPGDLDFGKNETNYKNAMNAIPFTQLGLFAGNQFNTMANNPKDNTKNPWMSALGGASTLAGTGASIGSMIAPGIGTAIGAGAGALLGGISSFVSTKKQNKEIEKQNEAVNVQRRDAMRDRDRLIKGNAASMGFGLNYYRYGGKLPTYQDGGVLQEIAPNTQEVVGPSHEQGGVAVSMAEGTPPIAEVEGGEIIKDEKVFSDKLIHPSLGLPFSYVAKLITTNPKYIKEEKEREKATEKLNDIKSNFANKNTARRNLEKNPDPLKDLFALQEKMAAQQVAADNWQNIIPPKGTDPAVGNFGQDGPTTEDGIPIARNGINLRELGAAKSISNLAEATTPYLDNISNYFLTQNTPTIKAPEFIKAPVMKNKINVTPQIQEIAVAGKQRNKAINQNINNSAITTAAMLQGMANDTMMKNKIYADKENKETDLANQQAMVVAETQAKNAAKTDAYNQMNLAREDAIQSRTSANVADASENAMFLQAQENAKRKDKQIMALKLMEYANTGVLERSGFDQALRVLDNDGSIQEALIAAATKKKKMTTNQDREKEKRDQSINSSKIQDILKILSKFDKSNVNLRR